MIDPDFRINGCGVLVGEPQPYLDQAHAVLHCAAAAIRQGTEAPNDEIVASAVDAAATLVALAGFGWMGWTNREAPIR